MKQIFEEMQPIYVRKESRTCGHVFVGMLSYMIIKYIWDECQQLGSTREAILDNLSAFHYLQYTIVKSSLLLLWPNKDFSARTIAETFTTAHC